MKIAVCDDEREYCRRIYELVNEYAIEHGLCFDVDIFSTAEQIETAIQETKYDLLFLDIELPEVSGITLKNKMLLRHNWTWIVFVTNHEEMVGEAFGVNVLGFVKKKDLTEQISYHLDLMLALQRQDYLIAGKFHSRDVVCIHAEKEYSVLTFFDGKRELIRFSLRNLEKNLEVADFVRVSRADLINLQYIEEMKNNTCYMRNDLQISVSRRRITEVRNRFLEYSERNARYY